MNDLDFALPLASVERALRAVALMPLPGAPEVIAGVVNVHGSVVAVADLRRRFGRPLRPVRPEDHLLLVRAKTRDLILLADTVQGIVECPPEAWAPLDGLLPAEQPVHGVARGPDGLLLIQDIDRLLALDEEAALQQALGHE